MSLRIEMNHELRLEQRLNLGNFELQLLDKIQYVDINVDDPENEYHEDMLHALLARESEETNSLIGQIVLDNGLVKQSLEKVIIESFETSDVSQNIGTKRNVDRFTLKFKDGEDLVMTVSLDKMPVGKKEDSPSLQETLVLQEVKDPTSVWSVQRWLGSTFIDEEGEIRGLICKEFIPGQMLGNFTTDIEVSAETYGEKAMEDMAYTTGKMVANALAGLNGMPIDSNSLNIIISEKNDEIVARYCDVEQVRHDKEGIKKEIGLVRQEFGSFGKNFIQGIKDNYKGDLWKESI